MTAAEIAHAKETLGLIEGDEMLTPVGIQPGNRCGVVGKPFDTLFIEPAALLEQLVGVIPVEQGHVGFNAVFQHGIDEIGVEFCTFLIQLTGAVGEQTRPADREPVVLDAQLLHQLEIFLVAVVVVAGHIAGMIVFYMTGLMGVHIPNAQTLAAFIPAAFDLIGRGSCTPNEILFECHSDCLPIYCINEVYHAKPCKSNALWAG